jgi:DNA gyrase/topoisomerase IV subunit A
VRVEAINMRLRTLRRLEEVAIQKELESLGRSLGLETLLASERRQWRALAKEVAATRRNSAATHASAVAAP